MSDTDAEASEISTLMAIMARHRPDPATPKSDVKAILFRERDAAREIMAYERGRHNPPREPPWTMRVTMKSGRVHSLMNAEDLSDDPADAMRIKNELDEALKEKRPFIGIMADNGMVMIAMSEIESIERASSL